MGWYGTEPSMTLVPPGYGGRSTVMRKFGDVRPGTPLPLILLLHPNGGSGAANATSVGMDRAQNFDSGCYVLLPDGLPVLGGNVGFNYFTAPTPGDDFNYLNDLVALAKTLVPVSWVGVDGYSNGALMAIQMSLVYPLLFQTIVTCAGAGGVNDSVAVAPVPIPRLHIFGTADTVVPPAGEDPASHLPSTLNGHGGIGSTGIVSAVNTLAQAAARNGLAGFLGAAGAAFDFVTPTALECTAQLYSGTTTQDHCELWTCTAIAHSSMGIVSSNRRGSNPKFTWMRTYHRTP